MKWAGRPDVIIVPIVQFADLIQESKAMNIADLRNIPKRMCWKKIHIAAQEER